MKFKKYVALLIVLVLMASLLSTTAVAVESNEVRAINTLPRKPQVASLVECTEDTEVYRIPVYSQTRGLYYLDLELTGDKTAHTVTAKLKNSFALGSSTIDVTLKLYSIRYSTVLRGTAHDDDLDLWQSISVTHSNVSSTAKYYAVVTGTANGEDIYYSTYSIPFNSRGEKYPTHISSPVTGESLPYDFSVTLSAKPSSQWVPWNPTIKKEYAKYLGEDLSGYDVHHIVPRRYGGTNNYSNLIPLKKAEHTTVTNWWKYY